MSKKKPRYYIGNYVYNYECAPSDPGVGKDILHERCTIKDAQDSRIEANFSGMPEAQQQALMISGLISAMGYRIAQHVDVDLSYVKGARGRRSFLRRYARGHRELLRLIAHVQFQVKLAAEFEFLIREPEGVEIALKFLTRQSEEETSRQKKEKLNLVVDNTSPDTTPPRNE